MFLTMKHRFLAVFVAMLEIRKLFFWRAWARHEANGQIALEFTSSGFKFISFEFNMSFRVYHKYEKYECTIIS